jgi:hypothetical protein
MSNEDAKKVCRADRSALESCHIAVQTGANTAVESVVQCGCDGRSTKSYLCVLDSGPKLDDWRANGMQGSFSKASDFSEW